MPIVDVQGFRYYARGDFWARLWRHFNDDHCWGMAAELAYCLLLAFFPFLIFLGGLSALLPIELVASARLVNEVMRFLPSDTQAEVSRILENAEGWKAASRSAFIWMGISLWAASIALNAMAGVLTRAYRIRDRRSYLHVRLLSVVVTIGMSVFVLVGAFLLFFGDDVSRWAISRLDLQDGGLLSTLVVLGYATARWSLIFILTSLGLQTMYFALPARRLPLRLISPGSFAISLGLIGGSLAFQFLVNNFADYGNLYGNLAGLIILMVWFYYCSLFLLLGGQIDSTIFRLSRARRRLDS